MISDSYHTTSTGAGRIGFRPVFLALCFCFCFFIFQSQALAFSRLGYMITLPFVYSDTGRLIMPGWLNWILLILGVVLGLLAGVLAAKVSPVLFWVLWLPGLACVGAFIYFSRRNGAKADGKAPSK